MDISETDFETVLSKLFDDEKDPHNVSARRLIKKIAPYVGGKCLELEELYSLLDPKGCNSHVSRDTFKTALLQWSDIMKIPKESCFIEEVSLVTRSSDSDQYTNISSMSNNSYKERIVELQNELAEKEHIVKSIRKQLEYSAQVTQQHEDALTQVSMERDSLLKKLVIAQNNTNMCESLKKDYDEQVEYLNVYREKCNSLEHIIDTLRRDNLVLNTKVQEIENEKHSLIQLISAMREDKDRMQTLLSSSHSDLEILMSENVNFKERITQQEDVIKSLHVIKHSLEVDLQNSINKSVHLTQFMDRLDDSFGEPLVEDLKSQLQDKNMSISTPVKMVRSHSEGSIGKKLIATNNISRDISMECTLRTHTSLMEELQQVTESSTLDDTSCVTSPVIIGGSRKSRHPVVSCEAESTSDANNCSGLNKCSVINISTRESFSNIASDKNALMLKHIVVCLDRETQTDVSGVVAIENNLALTNTDSDNTVCKHQQGSVGSKVMTIIYGVLDKFFFYGTCFCFAFAFLQLYSTMRYCHNIRRGTNVRIYPSEWFTLQEVLDSLFEVQHTGPAPI